MTEHPEEHLVTVYSVPNAETAEIIRIALEEAGIRCALGNEHQAAMTGLGDMMSVEILVGEHDAERARELIKSHMEK